VKQRTGLSDITIRVKANVLKRERGGVALGVDVRTPTGEPLDFLGAGAFGVKPFVIGSFSKKIRGIYLAPHVNGGFEWNGNSILGGPLLGVSGRIARRLAYSAGTEVGMRKRATLTVDLIGQRLFSAERQYTFPNLPSGDLPIALGGLGLVETPTGSNTILVSTRSINLLDGAVGAKFHPWGNLLLTGNLAWRLNRPGLRARMVPLVGISYSF
jgi:hypothetical protein